MRDPRLLWLRFVLALMVVCCLSAATDLGHGVAYTASATEDGAEPLGPDADPRDALSVSATVSPSGMAVPGEAQVYITLANGATDPISDIEICKPDGTLIESVGTLSGSGKSSYVFYESVTPTYSQLRGGGIEYQIEYTLGKGGPGETKRSQTVLAPVVKLKAEPSLEFTRSPSSNYVQPGEQVSITYRLKNTGNVTLTDLVLKDALCGEIGRAEQLAPGKKVTFLKSVTIDGTADSKPTVSYSYVSSEKALSKKLDPLTIYLAEELLEVHLDADKTAVSPGEIVTLQLKLTNRGNVAYDKLEISDQILGALGSVPKELRPGVSYVFVKRVPLKSTSTFLFTVDGKSAGGSPVSASSNMLTVAVTPAVDDIRLSLTATPDSTELQQPGYVTFDITIHNEGELDIRNVMLSEQHDGEIKNLAVVAPGDMVVPQRYYVDATRSFVFMAELSDAQGGRSIVRCSPIEVQVESGKVSAFAKTRTPEATRLLGIEGAAYHMDERVNTYDRMMTGVLCVLGVLVAAFMAGGLSRLMRKRELRRRQLRKLRRGRRNARLEQAPGSGAPDAEAGARDNTGVYKKADIISKVARDV